MADNNPQKMNSGDAVIELAGVDVTQYEGASDEAFVRGVNWRIGLGEFWVVGGRPSSGKSSLLLTAAGLNRPAGGTLRIFGQDLADASEKDQVAWRRRIGFAFEYAGRLFSHLTVAQNIALPLRYHRAIDDAEVAARVDELLTSTGLQDYADSMPSRLSLGIQQRAGLARALASPVEVLFLDDPLTTLSQREMRWWLDFLRQLRDTQTAQGRPLTIVASADDFHGWIDVATHFAIVGEGRFNTVGGREQLAAAVEPGVREFLMNEA